MARRAASKRRVPGRTGGGVAPALRRGIVSALVLAGLLVCAAPAGAQDRALLIGLDRYADRKLGHTGGDSAANDVAAVKALLVDKLAFEESAIKVLRDGAATRTGILAAIHTWLGPQPGSGGDRTYLYFAGLGFFEPDQGQDESDGLDETLVPFDAQVEGHGETAEVTGMIADEEFTAALGKLEGRHITVVLDTGHSGLVTRARSIAGKRIEDVRAPDLRPALRSMAYDPSAARQKAEGGFVETVSAGRSLAVWSAVSFSQAARVEGEGAQARGLFTRLYVEGIAEGAADANGNGIITALELLRHVRAGSAAYCAEPETPCEMGLTPRLDPPPAFRRTVLVDPLKENTADGGPLSFERLFDFLVEDDGAGLEIEQLPPPPLRVGMENIRFEVTSRKGGKLVLLNLTGEGALFQLFPNRFSGSGGGGHSGRLAPGVPRTIPGEDDGLKLAATVPVKGRIVALVGPGEADLPKSIGARPVDAVTGGESTTVYLPDLSAALGQPVHAGDPDRNTAPAGWSVETQSYEILPETARGN